MKMENHNTRPVDGLDQFPDAPAGHLLTVFNAVDLPDSVAQKVMALIDAYNPDVYTRACDETGRVL